MKASFWILVLLPLAVLEVACNTSSSTGPSGTTIVLSPSSVGFAAFQGAGDPASQTVQVSASGAALSGVALGAVQYQSGTGWLTASLNGLTVTLAPATGGLGAGTYSATVPVTAANASNTPSIAVTLIVANCTGAATTTLAVGENAVLDPTTTNGCLRLPAAGLGGAEHLVVALSAAGVETPTGTRGTYQFISGPSPAPPAPAAGSAPVGSGSPALAFHAELRRREAALARDPATRLPALAPRVAPAPPQVGDQRTFNVCASTTCTSFVQVKATAKHVGPRGAIFVDDTVPAGGYTQTDIDAVGTLFDTYLYPIDTTAFGRESDLDNNGVVIILLTDQVNKLSGNCNTTGSVILGYFFGLDLTNQSGSNQGEIFYSVVPDPTNSACTISKSFAQEELPPTFIHEFQHMISFNRHVLLPPTISNTEDTWLNEGLSMFAQELGGRQVPNSNCPDFASAPHPCLSQFAGGNLLDAYRYLANPEGSFLVVPGDSLLTLAEYGSAWLFVRWFTEQSPTDTLLATDMTRALEGADNPSGTLLHGSANVAAAASAKAVPWTSFENLVSVWQLANYLEGLQGFADATGRLQYRDWDLRSIFTNNPNVFAKPYPLTPDSTLTGTYSKSGVLLAGSGHHLRVIQAASASAVSLVLSTTNTAAVIPRYAVIRVR